jgi:hypothetical protein
MLEVEAEMFNIDFKVLEQEIDHFLRRPDEEEFSGRYIKIVENDNKDAYTMLR